MRVDKQGDDLTIIDDRFRLLHSINSIVIDDRYWVIALFVIDMVQGWGKYEIGGFEEDVAGELKCLITDCAFESNLKFSALRGSSQYPTSSQDTQGRFRLGAEIGSPSRCLSRRLMVDLVGNEVCDIWTMLPIGLVSRTMRRHLLKAIVMSRVHRATTVDDHATKIVPAIFWSHTPRCSQIMVWGAWRCLEALVDL